MNRRSLLKTLFVSSAASAAVTPSVAVAETIQAPCNDLWAPVTARAAGEVLSVDDAIYVVTCAGTSGPMTPAFADKFDHVTLDGTVLWQCIGKAA